MKTAIRCALVLLFSGIAAAASAQGQSGGPPQNEPVTAPAEMQKLLDGYAIIQGQEFLSLTDSQFTQFLPKFRALQEARRRNEMDRLRLVQELNRITNPRGGGSFGDNDIRDRLRTLRELEVRAVGDLQKARDAIDQTLDLRQQARFRVFEEQIEQRKLQLLMQVRQANRANRPPARPRQ
ncbi:MAG: hypothetical protein EXQ55_04590 [Acidobacteria bacterium]|nr:hypothetical protein [Acidobacteriota bacterium]